MSIKPTPLRVPARPARVTVIVSCSTAEQKNALYGRASRQTFLAGIAAGQICCPFANNLAHRIGEVGASGFSAAALSHLALLWHFRLGDICKEPVTVRTLSGWRSREEVEDRLPDGRHAWLWWRS